MFHLCSFSEPSFNHSLALAPFQPLLMKAVHCPIDTSLNFGQSKKLIRDLKPGCLVVPEIYTHPPAATPNRSDLKMETVSDLWEKLPSAEISLERPSYSVVNFNKRVQSQSAPSSDFLWQIPSLTLILKGIFLLLQSKTVSDRQSTFKVLCNQRRVTTWKALDGALYDWTFLLHCTKSVALWKGTLVFMGSIPRPLLSFFGFHRKLLCVSDANQILLVARHTNVLPDIKWPVLGTKKNQEHSCQVCRRQFKGV